MGDYQRKSPFKLVILTTMPPLDQPAAVYLAALARRSRRTQRSALDQLAQLLAYPDALACPWASLRYQHTAAIRAELAERYAPATANKLLAALKRTLQEAWRLRLMPVEEYQRVAVIAATARDLVEKRDRWLNPEGATEAEL